ncbi:MAG: cyanophycinase [Cyanobacteria bacterium RYN_339]|nr:cyanophycinase [Cyanobacteria bacterium RYN_339]
MRCVAILLAVMVAGCGHDEPVRKPAGHYQLRQADGPGPLFLVGGGDDSPALLGRFLDLAGGKAAPIVIVPFAGGDAQGDRYLAYFKDRGATNLTVMTGVAADHAVVRGAAGLWFAGGSPDKLLTAFKPFFDDVRAARQAGAAIGGHSAGSMIWGTGVIVKGESSDVIAKGKAALAIEDGVGLLGNTIFDPHFSERARFTRLWTACGAQDALGIGIDPETAAYLPNQGPMEVFGIGAVTVIKPEAGAARVAVVSSGQRLDLKDWRL